MTAEQNWKQARIKEMMAVDQLKRIHPSSGQISHAQAQSILVGFCEQSGFKQISTSFQNLSDERGWTFTETT